MSGGASISECGRYRWALTRTWGDEPYKTICWIMLNPSTADAERDDPTIRECIKRSRAWGYDRLVVVNLFPLRSPYPKVVRRWFNTDEAQTPMAHNKAVIAVTAAEADAVVCAWGAGWSGSGDDEVEKVAAYVLEGLPMPLHVLGRTANGSPKHPLARGRHRIAGDQQPIPFSESPK